MTTEQRTGRAGAPLLEIGAALTFVAGLILWVIAISVYADTPTNATPWFTGAGGLTTASLALGGSLTVANRNNKAAVERDREAREATVERDREARQAAKEVERRNRRYAAYDSVIRSTFDHLYAVERGRDLETVPRLTAEIAHGAVLAKSDAAKHVDEAVELARANSGEDTKINQALDRIKSALNHERVDYMEAIATFRTAAAAQLGDLADSLTQTTAENAAAKAPDRRE